MTKMVTELEPEPARDWTSRDRVRGGEDVVSDIGLARKVGEEKVPIRELINRRAREIAFPSGSSGLCVESC
jgi:hypothetical protein